MLVSEATLNNYVQTKVGYIATFIIKLAALEHKGKLLRDCLSGTRTPPQEWQTKRSPPVLPTGVQYSFSTTLEMDALQSRFDTSWMSTLEKDITNTLVPRLQTRIQSLLKEAEEEIRAEMGTGPVATRALNILNEEVRKKLEAREKQYSDGQTSATSAALKRKFQPPQKQYRTPFKPRDNRKPTNTPKQTRYSRPNYKRAGWTKAEDN